MRTVEARHTTQADHSIWQQHLRLVQSVLAVAFLQHVGVLKNCVPATIIKRPRWLCSGQLTKVSTLPSKKPLLLTYCSISLFETRNTFTVHVAKPARGNFVAHLPSAVRPNQSYTFQVLFLRYLVSFVMMCTCWPTLP